MNCAQGGKQTPITGHKLIERYQFGVALSGVQTGYIYNLLKSRKIKGK
jgi:hypothetical protein